MPVFHLQLHEWGTFIADEEGPTLPDRAAAVAMATQNARDITAGEVKAGRLCLGCCIVMEDANRIEVGRVPFREALALSGL